jgi:xanthine dehydrogenase iron-sulfur cluster and FAD-binding subunit A
VVVAGGTEVMPLRNRGERPGPLLDLSRVAELRAVEDGDPVRLGAAVTYTRQLEELAEPLPVLALAARTIASRQVRNRATLGGALAIADPSADILAALVAAGAEVELASGSGVRRLPVAEFLTGPYERDLGGDELIVAVLVPRAAGPAAYAKVGARNAMARAACAVAVVLDTAGRTAGICVAASAPTPVRATAAEELVAAEAPWASGGELEAGFVSRVGVLVAEATRPRSDSRGSAEYKRHAAAVLGGRALARAWRARTADAAGAARPRPSGARPPDDSRAAAPARARFAHPPRGATGPRLRVDGAEHALPEEAGADSLLRVLRDELGLTAPKNACEEGECGSCTVAIDGEIACACLVPAAQAAGCEVETAAGLAAADGALHPVQEAFLEAGGVQCGFCTPGFVMAARDLLRRVPEPTDEDVREGLNGNLCRCTGYEKIVAAVRLAAER